MVETPEDRDVGVNETRFDVAAPIPISDPYIEGDEGGRLIGVKRGGTLVL